MGQLLYQQQDGSLELDGLLLQHGDKIALRILNAWVPGTVAHDQVGWYFVTSEHVGIRLKTGLKGRLLSRASETISVQGHDKSTKGVNCQQHAPSVLFQRQETSNHHLHLDEYG